MSEFNMNENVDLRVGNLNVNLNSKGKITLWKSSIYAHPEGLQMEFYELEELIRVIQMFKLTKAGWIKNQNTIKQETPALTPHTLNGIKALKQYLINQDKKRKRKSEGNDND